jgi:hypothetical protein
VPASQPLGDDGGMYPYVDIITRSSELKADNSNNRNPASLEPLPIA